MKITASTPLIYKSQNNQPNIRNNYNSQSVNTTKLSGFNNPMKNYVSFGWCDAHYQAMYEIDVKISDKINQKLQEIEQLKDRKRTKYSVSDNASFMAAKLLAQYANMQCVVAEVPPSYAVVSGSKLKEAMDNSNTFTDPVNSLTAINYINKMNAKNDKLDKKHLERGKGAAQLYAVSILLNQIDENKNKPEFSNNLSKIDELTSIVKQSCQKIYGDDIFERLEYFSEIGKKPSDKDKADALDFLIETDANAKALNLPNNFEEQLQILINAQNTQEQRTQDNISSVKESFSVNINYPDHDHSVMHAHGIPHSHSHSHTHPNIEHSHQNKQTVFQEDSNKKLITQ